MNRMCICAWTAASAVIATCAGSLWAAEKPAAPQKITSVEGITEYRLGNGLRVLLFPDESKPTVTVNATYLVGSRSEGYGETGMAHLLEHMVFKGTPKHPKIWKEMQDHGASFNGSTNYDRTNYFETVAATDENLDWALSLESDRMVNSNIAKSDLESEFSVVRNEFERGENSPERVLEERIWSTAYLWHNYGKSTIGSKEDIERVPIDALKAFYQKYYQPDDALLIVAGKFDAAKTLTRINELFGSIPKPTRVLSPAYTVEPAQDGEREVVLRRIGDVQVVSTAYHICAGAHEDMTALEVLADVLDATQTGRLYKALVETQMATQVRASAEALFDPGLMQFTAEVPTDKPLDAARKTLIEVVENLGKQDITDEEVQRSKNEFVKRFEQLMGDSGRVGLSMSEWGAQGDWRLMFLHRDRMKAVTPADVKRVAAKYLKSSNRTTGVFIPTKDIERTTVPPTPDIVALLKDYKGQAAIAAGEAFEATPAAIDARTQRGALACGIKTALLPKKTRGQRVNVELVLRYGSEDTLKGRTDAAALVGPMLERGTAKHSRRQLEDELTKLKATVNIGAGGGMMRGRGRRGGGGGAGGPGSLSVNIDCVRENLPAVVALVGEMLRESNFPKGEFDKLQKQMLTGIEQGRSEPMMLGALALQRRMSQYPPEDIRYVPTMDERIARLTAVKVDDVKKVYADLLGAGTGELAAVGDFDPKELTDNFDKILGGWKTSQSYERIAMPFQAVTADQIVIDTPDKKNSQIMMGTRLEVRDDDADYPALEIGNMILGQGGNSRLINRLRQKEGYSYNVGTMLMASAQDKACTLTMTAICAPQNAEKAAHAADEELDRLLKEGVTQKELDDAKQGYAQQLKVQLASDGAIAGMLAGQAHLGRTMKFIADQSEKIQALTLDQVNGTIRKYLKGDHMVRVRAGDFGSKKTVDASKESAD